jgi:ABC-type dipeptide/oligopeptide/nickel transport system permease subunit
MSSQNTSSPVVSNAAMQALMKALRSLALLRESKIAIAGCILVGFWIIVALVAPFAAPFPPNAQIQPFAVPLSAAPNGGMFLLGTDQLGRDILSRLMWGARTVLFFAPLATFSAYLVGITMGLAAGYFGGWIDDLLSRISDLILSFPVLVLYILIIATIGASGINIIIAVTFASAPGVMRIVRGLVLDLRTRNYVAAAQTRGENPWYIMLIEILPNARGPLIVDGCLRIGYVIITIGVLGFLGLGLPPPDPDWGGMINEARALALAFPHMTVIPCIAISTLVLGFNLLADGIREVSMHD